MLISLLIIKTFANYYRRLMFYIGADVNSDPSKGNILTQDNFDKLIVAAQPNEFALECIHNSEVFLIFVRYEIISSIFLV